MPVMFFCVSVILGAASCETAVRPLTEDRHGHVAFLRPPLRHRLVTLRGQMFVSVHTIYSRSFSGRWDQQSKYSNLVIY